MEEERMLTSLQIKDIIARLEQMRDMIDEDKLFSDGDEVIAGGISEAISGAISGLNKILAGYALLQQEQHTSETV